MKVIDLLNKIANGEEVPKKIKYKGHIYQYQYKDTKEANIINYYHSEETHHHLIDGGYHDIRLNDEVEILEEEKKVPEKLFFTHISNYNDQSVVNNNFNNYFKKTQETINEIIDCLLKIEDKFSKLKDASDYLKSKGE